MNMKVFDSGFFADRAVHSRSHIDRSDIRSAAQDDGGNWTASVSGSSRSVTIGANGGRHVFSDGAVLYTDASNNLWLDPAGDDTPPEMVAASTRGGPVVTVPASAEGGPIVTVPAVNAFAPMDGSGGGSSTTTTTVPSAPSPSAAPAPSPPTTREASTTASGGPVVTVPGRGTPRPV